MRLAEVTDPLPRPVLGKRPGDIGGPGTVVTSAHDRHSRDVIWLTFDPRAGQSGRRAARKAYMP